MDLTDYEEIPEGISQKKLVILYDKFFDESREESIYESCEKLEILSEKQWHTYKLPSMEVRNEFTAWITKNWSNDQKYLETVLLVCYSFGLSKSVFMKAFTQYDGDSKSEFEEDLLRSDGNYMDPYWSFCSGDT